MEEDVLEAGKAFDLVKEFLKAIELFSEDSTKKRDLRVIMAAVNLRGLPFLAVDKILLAEFLKDAVSGSQRNLTLGSDFLKVKLILAMEKYLEDSNLLRIDQSGKDLFFQHLKKEGFF
jgi:hypothetical protein